MGYRGEDASRSRGERQPPWQSSSGNGSSGAGPWDDGSRGYTQGYEDYGYDAADTGADASSKRYRQQDYGRQGYEQQGYAPYDGYGAGAARADTRGGDTGDYGGYQEPGDAGGYDQASGYDQGGYDRGAGYPVADGYGRRDDRGYGGYQDPGSGGYRQQGGYPGQDAGNDWYGRQPAAASGASFADTGTYKLNGRVIDEYGTGPGQVLGDRDPVRGYPPASGPQSRYPDEYPAYPDQGYSQGEHDAYSRDGDDGYNDYDDASGGYAAGRGGSLRENQGGYDDYAAADDPYDDRSGAGAGRLDIGRRHPETSGRGGRPGAGGQGRSSGLGKRSLLGVLAIFAVAIAGVAAYVFVIKGHSAANNPNAAGAIPSVGSSSSSQAACAEQLGTYCHIELRTDDPTPLTVGEVFPPEFQNTTDKISYSLAATKMDKTCGNAVIGADLTAALQKGQCTQVLRASYVSGNGKVMGTIGVVNLSSTNQAHYAGKVDGQNDFVAPLDAPKGVASKMDNGTGLVESSFKGHYLILTWSIFVNGTKPTTRAEISELEQFGKDLVAGTVNIPLSERMVTGAPAVSGAA